MSRTRRTGGRCSSPLTAWLLVAGCAVPTPIGMVPAESTTTGDSESSGTTASTSMTATSVTPTSTGVATDPPNTDTLNTDTLPATESDTTVPEVVSALAIRYGDIPTEETTTGNSEVGGSGTGPDDDTLLLVISNGGPTCATPQPTSACGIWSVTILIPVEQQETGTYPLSDFNAFLSEQSPDDTSGKCGGSGGTLDGTLTIDSIDANEVVGRIENAQLPFDNDPNQEFAAPRC